MGLNGIMKNLLRFNFIILFLMLFMAMAVVISSPRAETTSQTGEYAQDIQKAEKYLQNMTTLKADFIQTAYNGSRLTGVFYLDRPGKLRFEYNEIKDFVVADGIFIYFYDSELGEQTNAPIGQTLADFLLRSDISLTDDVTVQNIAQEDNMQAITIVETDDPQSGSVKLFFTAEPYALKKWQVTDAAGLTTEILLRNPQTDIKLPASLFKYFKPKQDKTKYN